MCNPRADASREVSLKDITFTNTSLHVVSCSVKVSDCSFINSSVLALSTSFTGDSIITVQINGCNFRGNNITSLAIEGGSMNLYIFNTTFAFNKLHGVEGALLALFTKKLQESNSRITIDFTNTTVTQNVCPGRACFEFVAGMDGAEIALKMEKGMLESNVIANGEGSVVDVHGFANAKVELKSMHFQRNRGRAVEIYSGNSLELKIAKSEFSYHKIYQWDGGAVLVSNFTKKASASVVRSKFRSNFARNGGACAFVNIFSLVLDIENSQFMQNEALISGGALIVGNHNRTLEKSAIDVRSSKFIRNAVAMVNISTSIPITNSSLQTRDSGAHSYYRYAKKGGGGALSIYVSQVMRLSLADSIFADNHAQAMNSGAVRALLSTLYQDIEIVNCEFLRNSGGLESGTFQLIVKTPLPLFRAILKNLTFVNNGGNSIYDIYLSQNRLSMQSCKMQRNSGGGIFIGTSSKVLFIHMENTLLSDNINFGCNFYKDDFKNRSVYKFKNVSFVNNTCNTKDSILRIYMHRNQSFFGLQRSRFVDNFCKSGVVKVSVNSGLRSNHTKVIINNTEFRNNSGFAESTFTIRGMNEIIIQNSVFNTNFGATDGSHVRVQMRSSKLTINKVTFHQSNTERKQPFHGFFTATSFGSIYINETSFISDLFSVGSVPLILVKGAREVVMDDSVSIKAPLSTKLKMDNFTHLEMGENIGSSRITSFAFSTEPCPMRSYSIHRGSGKGFTLEDTITCYTCPNGGDCSSSLAARPNFWGYPIGDKVYFKLCPEGYCCPTVSQTCPYHHGSYLHSGCQGNRTGILCGQCKKDFSDGLFTTQCHPVRECNQGWLFSILMIVGTLFALYLITKPPLCERLMTNLTWFLPNHKQDDYNTLNDVKKPQTYSKDAFLKSLFYFYQVAGVLTASSYGVPHLLKDKIVLPITTLLNFQISVNNGWKICPLTGITPLSKTLFQLAFLTAIFISIPVMYLLHSGLNKLRRRSPALPPGGPYLGAALEMFLLGYSALTVTAKNLLYCVPIQHVSRWYYDAQFTCYQWWQSASLIIIALYLFPSIFSLYFSTFRLYQGKISAKMFLLACVCPFPYLLYIFILHVKKVTTQKYGCQEMTPKTNTTLCGEEDTHFPSRTEKSLIEVLCGPFSKPQNYQSAGSIYWESILIGRRFVIILISLFLEHAFLRSVCLTIICLTFLLHHLYKKPFAHFSANVVEAISLATLVVIAILNVGVASYFSVGSEVGGVNQKYITYFLLIEAILLGIVPLLFAVFVSLSLVLQLVRVVIILIQTVLTRWPFVRPRYNTQLSLGNQGQPLLPTNTL